GDCVYSHAKGNYGTLINLVKTHVVADCWAITITTVSSSCKFPREILFNEYDPTRSYRDTVLDDILRNQIIKNPKLILSKYLAQKSWDMMQVTVCTRYVNLRELLLINEQEST